MLSPEANERLTRVGPGTPCGELMRRYWIPVAPFAQLLENPVRKVRVLGEDLVLYKDRSGDLGLIGDRCLRPALVAVAKGGAKQAATAQSGDDGAPKAANDDFLGGGPQGRREPPRGEQQHRGEPHRGEPHRGEPHRGGPHRGGHPRGPHNKT